MKQQTKLKQFNSFSDHAFMAIVYTFLILFALLIILPLLNIVSSSFSSPTAVAQGRVSFWSVDFSLVSYRAVFANSDIMIGFRNSLIYTAIGTFINVAVAMLGAYPLSQRKFYGKKGFTLLFTFTMFFGGGMIPTYILVNNLHMLNTIWAMVLPGALSVYNMIIARTFIQSSIPEELFQAAEIDGSSDFYSFFRIVLPLSKPVLAVLALQFAVGHWNSYFNAMIYLTDRNMFPLQIFLRNILVLNQLDMSKLSGLTAEEMLNRQFLADVIKYAVIVVASVPVMIIYPFVQKYFTKGVMLGSLKG